MNKYNKYYFLENYVIGLINKSNIEFLISYEDYEKICKYTWCISDNGYIYTNINKKRVYLHRMIMEAKNTNLYVDHINHIKSDNRRNNLRLVTNSQNQMNRAYISNNSSKIKGVYWHKTIQKWQANLQINGKLLYLGVFDNLEEAVQARKEAEKIFFKEYNFRDTGD